MRNFVFAEVRGVLSFSLVAYLITFTNVVVMRADQAVISFALGVSFVPKLLPVDSHAARDH